jgi:hypothetical protein
MSAILAHLTAIIAGLVTTYVAGKYVECVLKFVEDQKVPEVFKRKGGGGYIIGILEGLFFFCALWQEAYSVIAGFLALKVASKWAAWQHIVKVPDPSSNDPVENLEGRNAAGTYLYSRFLVGTLYNFLCGVGGVAVGKGLLKLLGY